MSADRPHESESLTQRGLLGLTPAAESLLAGAAGLVLGALIMWVSGFDVWRAYAALFGGGFGGAYSLSTSLARATPLILTALTFAICMRAGMFNIGAEGQMYVGAIAAVTVGYFSLPPGLHLIVGLVFGMLVGAAWSLFPALLKVTRGVNEVISTIMFNWISHFLSYYLVARVVVDQFNSSRSIALPVTARFPILIPRTDLSYGIFASIAFALVIYVLLWHTVTGYEVRAAGLSPTAARYAGIKSKRTMILSFVLGGMAAGLAGAVMTMGNPPSYAVLGGMGGLENLGFDGMAVAMVGRNHPLGILISGLFFGGLAAGAREMQVAAGVPTEMVTAVQGIIVVALAIPELSRLFRLLRNRWTRTSRRAAA